MLLPPVHHPGPAGQFQGQARQIAFPARFGQTQPAQLGDHRVDRIVRPAGQRVSPARQPRERPGRIAFRQPAPGRVQSLRPAGQMPGRQTLVEISGGQADQDRANLIEQIPACQSPQQAAQRAALAHVAEQPFEQRRSFRLHPFVDDGTLVVRRVFSPESRQQRLCQIQLQIHQLFRVKVERRQPESLQAGPPQILQRRAGFARAIPPGGFQQALARTLRHIRRKSAGGVHLLHPPDQLVQGQRVHAMHQRNP